MSPVHHPPPGAAGVPAGKPGALQSPSRIHSGNGRHWATDLTSIRTHATRLMHCAPLPPHTFLLPPHPSRTAVVSPPPPHVSPHSMRSASTKSPRPPPPIPCPSARPRAPSRHRHPLFNSRACNHVPSRHRHRLFTYHSLSPLMSALPRAPPLRPHHAAPSAPPPCRPPRSLPPSHGEVCPSYTTGGEPPLASPLPHHTNPP